MKRETWSKVAMGGCLFGLFVGLIGLLPVFSVGGAFPWPVFVGAAVYMPSAFAVYAASNPADRKLALSKLRFIRLGFVAIFAIAVYRMMPLG